jgi:hypothetical protein
MRRLEIHAGDVRVLGELRDTSTADAIWNALPLSADANTWGDEIYFTTPVQMTEEDARSVVDLGDLGYWPPGHAFCVFFGLTPVSRGKEIRPASPVNVFGRVVGDLEALKRVKDGQSIRVLQVHEP